MSKLALILILISTFARADIIFMSGVSQEARENLLTDMKFIKSIEGSGGTEVQLKVFGEVNGSNYERYISDRIRYVGSDDCGGTSTVYACVKPTPGVRTSTMWITNNFSPDQMPQVFRVSLLIHEARHVDTEYNNWAHDKCPIPFRNSDGSDVVGIISGKKMEGHDACDRTMYGSYGVQTVFLKNLNASCTNCNEKVKDDARIYGSDMRKRILTKKSYNRYGRH